MRHANAHVVIHVESYTQLDQSTACFLGGEIADQPLEVAAGKCAPKAIAANDVSITFHRPIADQVDRNYRLSAERASKLMNRRMMHRLVRGHETHAQQIEEMAVILGQL